ncbi:hypothetical protein [Blastococcus montanus]|uniref:hypothetical protein n=1 Tax=Blastococcus montanus TaxID=3144973 RepID=UPI003207BB48
MNEQETIALRDRLDRLADRSTPPIDVVGLVRNARERNRRQRQGRVAVLAAAAVTAAVAIGVPLGLGALDSSGPGGVAGPGGGSAPAVVPPSGGNADADRAELAAEQEQRALQQRLDAAGAAVARALEEPGPRPAVVSLTAPAATFPCPEDTGELQAALGGIPLSHRAGTLPGDMGACEWSAPGSSSGGLADHFSAGIGFTPGWTAEEFTTGLPTQESCQQTVVQSATGPGLVVEVCADRSSTRWTVFALDSSGSGAWTFGVTAGADQPIDGASAVVAAVRLADTLW